MNAALTLLARLALSLVFLGSAVNKITGFEGTRGYMESYGMPATGLLLPGAIAFLLVGGVSVALGYRARVGAILLIVFLVPATLVFHFDPSDESQMIQVMKNLAILGGLLLVVANGAGPGSLDARRSQEPETTS